jgi:hypothetical protein
MIRIQSAVLFGAAFVIAFVVLTNPAMARADVAAQISALPLNEMCSKDGALGQRFGTTDLPASTALSRGTANKPLEARFTPFAQYGLSTAQYSGTMYEAVFSGLFETKAEEAMAIAAIAARFTTDGWTPVIGRNLTAKEIDQGIEGIYLIPEEGNVDLYLNAADAETGLGIRISLQPSGDDDGDSRVTLFCQDGALLAKQIAEAAGEYPADLPRPIPPIKEAVTVAVKPTNCDDPAIRKQAIDDFKNGDWMANKQANDEEEYQEKLAAWKSTKLVTSGKIDRETLTGRKLDQIVDSGAVDVFNENIEEFSQTIPEIEKLEKFDKSGDTFALCRGLEKFKIQLSELTTKAGTSNREPWVDLHQFLDAEAARLGVVFPSE